MTQLDTGADSRVWISEGTYLRTYLEEVERHFPSKGQAGKVYFTDLNYAEDLGKIDQLVADLKEREKDILLPDSVQSWHTQFMAFANRRHGMVEIISASYLRPLKNETY